MRFAVVEAPSTYRAVGMRSRINRFCGQRASIPRPQSPFNFAQTRSHRILSPRAADPRFKARRTLRVLVPAK